MDYLSFANSSILWISVCLPVSYVLLQAGIMLWKAVFYGRQAGITTREMKAAASASAVASIGPSMVIAINSLALTAVLGAPIAFLRLSYIGSITFELSAANMGAKAAGADLATGASVNLSVFATCCWVMCIACLGWIISSSLFTDKLGTFTNKLTNGNSEKIIFFTGGGCIGVYSFLVISEVRGLDKHSIIASVVAFFLQALITLYGRCSKAAWPTKWGFSIAIFTAMIVAGIV